MPNIRSRLLCDGVTETVVPGQTRTSPPRGRCRTVVSDPAVTEDPAPMRLPDIAMELEPAVTGTTDASFVSEKPVAVSGSNTFLPAFTSSGGLSRTIDRKSKRLNSSHIPL